ncbi:transposable element Tcb1 transposase [Trichonephila clavipes]|nr:transposable element Tcb1 transposase [Trichonephila clavipes]
MDWEDIPQVRAAKRSKVSEPVVLNVSLQDQAASSVSKKVSPSYNITSLQENTPPPQHKKVSLPLEPKPNPSLQGKLTPTIPKKEDFGKRSMPGKRARRHFSQLSEFERGLIIEMNTVGWLTHRVAGQVDRSEKTTRKEDRRIVRQALEDPTVTRSTIRADVGVAIVPQTISRHLAEANHKSKRPFRALSLTLEHRQLRLQWCQARSMWNVTDWQKVVLSDESRFVLGTDDNRVRVWRHPGERYNSPHTVLRHTARTAGVMVWRVKAYDGRSTLIVMRGTLTGQRYVDDFLRPHVGPFLNGLPGAIFQQEFLKTSYVIFRLFYDRHAPPICPL